MPVSRLTLFFASTRIAASAVTTLLTLATGILVEGRNSLDGALALVRAYPCEYAPIDALPTQHAYPTTLPSRRSLTSSYTSAMATHWVASHTTSCLVTADVTDHPLPSMSKATIRTGP